MRSQKCKHDYKLPGEIGSSNNSTFIQFLSKTSAELSPLSPFEKTIPGQSNSLIFLSKCISCATFVNPGVEPTPQTFDRFNELITEDLPTFGKPITPTVMDVFRFAFRQ